MGSCTSPNDTTIFLSGKTQGTTYHITYLSPNGKAFQKEIDAILKNIDASMSTWEPNSIISRINDNDTTVVIDDYFRRVYTQSVVISEATEGAFDCTIGPLVNAYGFGSTTKKTLDKTKVDSLLQLVNYRKITLRNNKIIKEKPEIKIDFNAIAQGFSVDILADFLERQGIKNYLIEIGGEIKTKGKKGKNNWKVGIEQPIDNPDSQRNLEAIITLENKALATSGNYRKFYVEGNQKFSHIINPKTGYPAKHNLLSTTVIADDATTADAYATAFMVMGLSKSIAFIEKNKHLHLEAYFIYDEKGNWKTYASESLKTRIQKAD
ncbi:FAD:protein FMN transferase [Flavobacterium sp. UMI-01]|nr:FAD:protein FMN transferase [Flavobacterium sp. UMI-01]